VNRTEFDVVIVGAGINGAVAAAVASAAGLRVLIVDRGDFAGFTSQESSNLVWGGIKYLQGYEFWLVFKLCLARNRLMRAYPNQIREIGFLASIGPTAPFGRLLGTFGTLFYWAIGLLGTSAPRSYSAKRARRIQPNLLAGRQAVEYFDAELPDNDSRFVYDFIRRAVASGAEARNYTELIDATKLEGAAESRWQLRLRDRDGECEVSAKTVINAAGPFAADVAEILGAPTRAGLVFSKGVHFTLNRRLTAREQVLAFWDEQSRLFYVLPMGDRSMIGTTDTRVDEPVTEVTQADIDFVLRQINAQLDLQSPITPDQIVSSRCGVRPLVVEAGANGKVADWHQLSRKHIIEANLDRSVVSVLGGKLTDCLNVGQEILAELKRLGHSIDKPGRWYGEGLQSRRQEFFDLVRARVEDGQNAEVIAAGLWRRHGEQAFAIVGDGALSDLFDGLGITAQELTHIAANEQVVHRADLLRRRLPIAMARSSQELASNARLQKLLAELGL
jgi:glycerol-3-phosphate dehydrogenase